MPTRIIPPLVHVHLQLGAPTASNKPSWLTQDMRSQRCLGADELMANVDTGQPHTLGPDHVQGLP